MYRYGREGMGVEDGEKQRIHSSGGMPKEVNAIPIDGVFGFDLVNHSMEKIRRVRLDIPSRGIVCVGRGNDEVLFRRQSCPRIDHHLAVSPRAMQQKHER